MDEIRLKNYRCFKDEQRARLAPLTILVGENSAGKSSFLAMVRALWDIFYNHKVPNFNEDPFDFGTFHNIIFSDFNERASDSFEAGFRIENETEESKDCLPIEFGVEFGKSGTAPFPNKLTISSEKRELMFTLFLDDTLTRIGIQTKSGRWRSEAVPRYIRPFEANRLTPLLRILESMKPVTLTSNSELWENKGIEYTSLSNLGSNHISENDWRQIEKLLFEATFPSTFSFLSLTDAHLPYASSPIRSKPMRIYQPKLLTWDSEGNFAPMYLANLFETERGNWDALKAKIDAFGSESGLFEEILIHTFGQNDGGPFEVQVRKASKRVKGKNRNLIDVGYGVSQILPIVIELVRSDSTQLLLLQQPEVHLHPSAQAALGSLLLQNAHKKRIVIVESHSDHLLNRIRMDLRDGVSSRKPEDVSILYFENSDLSSRIHSLRIDEQGNVLDAPQSYGRFFMDETKRSLNL